MNMLANIGKLARNTDSMDYYRVLVIYILGFIFLFGGNKKTMWELLCPEIAQA